MKLAEVLRLAYTNASEPAGEDVFEEMADAVVAEFGPLVHRVAEKRDDGSVKVHVNATVGEKTIGRSTELSPHHQLALPGVKPVINAVLDAETSLRKQYPELSPIHYINGGER